MVASHLQLCVPVVFSGSVVELSTPSSCSTWRATSPNCACAQKIPVSKPAACSRDANPHTWSPLRQKRFSSCDVTGGSWHVWEKCFDHFRASKSYLKVGLNSFRKGSTGNSYARQCWLEIWHLKVKLEQVRFAVSATWSVSSYCLFNNITFGEHTHTHSSVVIMCHCEIKLLGCRI